MCPEGRPSTAPGPDDGPDRRPGTRPAALPALPALLVTVAALAAGPATPGAAAETAAIPASTPRPATASLDLPRALPRDPLAVVAGRFDGPDSVTASLGAALALAGIDAGATELLDDVERSIDFPMRRELLAELGPRWALVVDVPPFDRAVARMDASASDLVATILGRVGLVVEVREEAGARRATSALLSALGGQPVDGDGPARVRLQGRAAPGAPALTGQGSHFDVYWGVARGRLALGFSAGWVAGALEPRPPGSALRDGEDFARVFSHLDPDPAVWTYVNLPRARDLVAGSAILRALLAGTPAARVRLDKALEERWLDLGLGTASHRVDGGLRTSSFGPGWLPSGLLAGGVAAVSSFAGTVDAADRQRASRTLVDMERIARACGRFSDDAHGYPGPTEGWVPVERIAVYLEPVYVAALPRTDAWDNPLLYWSDGDSYRLISTGRDGTMDRDWSASAPADGGAGAGNGDIVIVDGLLTASPRLDD